MNTDPARRETDRPAPPDGANAATPIDLDATDSDATEALGPDDPNFDPTRALPKFERESSSAASVEPVPGYRVERRLGRGGFGEVWQATGPGGVSLALKLIRLEDGLEQGEIRALDFMRTIRHPQLIAVAGAWQTDDRLVIAMELADSTLQAALDQALAAGESGIEPTLLAEQMREAAKGIDYLNGLGIVHRDIKPQNLLLMGGGVKVADFGLARVLESSGERSRLSLTPSYAAPELCRGEASARTDQYALAVTYCKLRGGRLPFEGHHYQVMQGHLHGTPDLTMLPEVDRPVVARALSKLPADRWPDCRSFVAALASLRPDEAPLFVAVPAPTAVSRRAFVGALAGAAALGGAAIGSAARARHSASDPSGLAEMRSDEILADVSLLRQRPPEPIRSAPPGSEVVDRIPPAHNDAFTIRTDERVVDLRRWVALPDPRTGELVSSITQIRRVWVIKNSQADALHFQSRTSGRAVFYRSLNQRAIRQIDQREPESLAGQMQHAAEAIVDVADIPVGGDFMVEFATTYWNSVQTSDDQWFGVVGYGTAKKVSQLLVFPEQKPFRSYQLKTARLGQKGRPPEIYDKPTAILTGREHDWINWDIHYPEDGIVYRVEWTW